MWSWDVLSGGGNLDDRFVDVARGAAGSLHALGVLDFDYGALPGQLMLVKYDTAGNMVWRRANIVPGATQVTPMAVADDPLGNVIAVATFWDGTDRDMFVIKWSAAGAARWTAVKGSADPSLDDEATDVVTGKAGNVHVCGAMGSRSSAVVVKYDADDGLEKWTHYTSGNHATESAQANSIAGDPPATCT